MHINTRKLGKVKACSRSNCSWPTESLVTGKHSKLLRLKQLQAGKLTLVCLRISKPPFDEHSTVSLPRQLDTNDSALITRIFYRHFHADRTVKQPKERLQALNAGLIFRLRPAKLEKRSHTLNAVQIFSLAGVTSRQAKYRLTASSSLFPRTRQAVKGESHYARQLRPAKLKPGYMTHEFPDNNKPSKQAQAAGPNGTREPENYLGKLNPPVLVNVTAHFTVFFCLFLARTNALGSDRRTNMNRRNGPMDRECDCTLLPNTRKINTLHTLREKPYLQYL